MALGKGENSQERQVYLVDEMNGKRFIFNIYWQAGQAMYHGSTVSMPDTPELGRHIG